ncbi:hypothetical protein Y032_0002g875 [Ancylostoma ceylanicum]|nr:hypothetical protein Y032_0002g875 [Ancylostoma ceylanicum]
MGEDSQVSVSDESYGLSPALYDSEKFDELEGIICSVDGSYAALKQTIQNKADENNPCVETTLNYSRNVRSQMSGKSLLFQSGVVLDESHSIFANVPKKSQVAMKQDGSTVRLPQSLDTPGDTVRTSRAKYHEVNAVRIVGSDCSNSIANRDVQEVQRGSAGGRCSIRQGFLGKTIQRSIFYFNPCFLPLFSLPNRKVQSISQLKLGFLEAFCFRAVGLETNF